MAGPGRPGRKKRYDVQEWVYMPIRVPKEVWRAFRLDCFRREKKHSELVRELLEQHLQRAGLLKVLVRRDTSGHETKSYEVLDA